MPKSPPKQAIAHIIEPLRSLAVPVEDLAFDPENARVHPKRNVDAVMMSLREYGQRAPIIVQRDGMVVRAGNARLQAAKDLGWKYIAAVVTDDTDAVAKAFGLMDNKSADLAEWDFEKVADLLKGLDPDMLDLTGFADFEYNTLLEGDWNPGKPKDDEEDENSTHFHEGSGRHMITVNDAQWDIVTAAVEAYQKDKPEATLGEVIAALCSEYIKQPA